MTAMVCESARDWMESESAFMKAEGIPYIEAHDLASDCISVLNIEKHSMLNGKIVGWMMQIASEIINV